MQTPSTISPPNTEAHSNYCRIQTWFETIAEYCTFCFFLVLYLGLGVVHRFKLLFFSENSSRPRGQESNKFLRKCQFCSRPTNQSTYRRIRYWGVLPMDGRLGSDERGRKRCSLSRLQASHVRGPSSSAERTSGTTLPLPIDRPTVEASLLLRSFTKINGPPFYSSTCC